MQEIQNFNISDEVNQAISHHTPLVALESTVISHGLPYPENLKLAQDMEAIIRENGVTPATICVMDGKIQVGVNQTQLSRLSSEKGLLKVSLRDFAPALNQSKSGGTTVAGTMFAASKVGIRVFATGGVGGVHRGSIQNPATTFDISTDLYALANIPMIVVCAGAKAILDLPATLEVMETLGIPVVGFQTDEFPAFYSISSGLKTSIRAETPQEIVAVANTHWNLGLMSAILVTVPPPQEVALPMEEVNQAIEKAMAEVTASHIHGQNVTPFLLEKVSQYTSGASMKANLGLLHNNARVAALIAKAANFSG
jgi:pseudouridine-5'-phosphate glycosidase